MKHIRVAAIAVDELDRRGDEDEGAGDAIKYKSSKIKTVVHQP